MKCGICKKRRKTAPHHGIITTPDGQEIQEYDFMDLCIQCSNSGYYWTLNYPYKIVGNRFLTI